MGTRRLSPTSYALLGYLSMTPMSGYDLTVAVRKSIDMFWQISKSQIYKELPLLEADALITGTDVAQDHYPDKRVYQLTPAGAAALDDWLANGELPPPVSKIPELLKLFFGHRMDDRDIRAMLLATRSDHVASVARLEELIAQLDDYPPARWVRATARYGLLEHRAVIEWVDETLLTLEADDHPQPDDTADALDVIRRVPPRPRDVITPDNDA
ncbi:MAG: PadR family transcriptional regulator [Ilumatobacter sp.]|uniref:PadR family transcriptional regulator n=1 Tax=Ilumatobacter sp. TaxID=1967498 RepID=UPI0026085F6E|nr:PadR family transcriptional regulator [Ilumatobacter sp.]MDJ0769479.1 PadR family transcriptional regulator [Ilumatobacter sp.]